MSRYAILILAVILAASVISGACSNPKLEQRVAELEQQTKQIQQRNTELEQQNRELQQRNVELTQQMNTLTAPPKLIKSIDKAVTLTMNPNLWIPPLQGPIVYDGYFKLALEKGNRIEAEISTTVPQVTDCRILDPYGNILVRSAYNSQTKRFVQNYPWKFSLIAISSGDYEFKVDTRTLVMSVGKETAKISISIYNK